MKNLKLFANCIPINGYYHSLVIDLQFGELIPIPNDLYAILIKYEGSSVKEIINKFPSKYSSTIIEYFEYLKDKNVIFECTKEELEFYPPLSLDWDFPATITNATVEYCEKTFTTIISELETFNCKSLKLIINEYSPSFIKDILKMLLKTTFTTFEFQFNNSQKEFNLNHEVVLFQNFPRVQNIYFFNSLESKIIPYKNFNIYFIKSKYSKKLCGNISHYNFSINIPFFTESHHYNTCLNRKVCIDEKGYIKNCLSLDKNYGNIKDIKLKEVVSTKKFQKLWYFKKDDIKVCKDCEFRYMCMDCRAFRKDENDWYSQPAKCTYNPYIAKWKGEEGYITVEEWKRNQTEEVL